MNKDGKEAQGLLVVRQYFAMHEVALENLQMRDVEMSEVFEKLLGMVVRKTCLSLMQMYTDGSPA